MTYAVYNPNPCRNCGDAGDGNRICSGRCVPVEGEQQRKDKAADDEERRAELLREHARLGIAGH